MNTTEEETQGTEVTTEWTTTSNQSTGLTAPAVSLTGATSTETSSSYIIATAQSMSADSSSSSSNSSLLTLRPTQPGRTAGEVLPLDSGAIIAGSVVGLLLIAILLVSVCLARSRRQQHRGGDNSASAAAKTPRPAPAVAAVIAHEPNPYTNPCFVATNDEMGERVRKTEEPAKSTTEGINSVRNKEDQWIIPLEELADVTMTNFDTTKF